MHLILLAVANLAAADEINFELQIRPLLARIAVGCHGAKTRRADADWSEIVCISRRRWWSGHHPGEPENSSLIQRTTSDDPELKMPPEGPAPPASEIELLRPLDRERCCLARNRLRSFCDVLILDCSTGRGNPSKRHSLRPWVSSNAPTAAITEIDRFILAELSKHQLDLSEPADRRTLIRRLSFDLLGLPRTPNRFGHSLPIPIRRAYEKLVDTFLASTHYGERWARHWLDIAHYADTHGFERDQRRDNAWRYRDWVIRAINNDMPYDQFLRDQIAGDAVRPAEPEAVIATGFLAAGPWDL